MTEEQGRQGQVRLTLTVTGEVQAVGFRYRTLQRALRLGVKGIAENRVDGSVHIIAEGSQDAVEALLGFLRSPEAPGTVRHIDVQRSAATGEFADFGTA